MNGANRKEAAGKGGGPISADHVVNDVMKRHPRTIAVFARYDLDMCCGGVHIIRVAAAAKGVDLGKLLADLNAEAED